MNPGFIDPHNHVPDVSADDGWDHAEELATENRPAATVLPPRRKAADKAPEKPVQAEPGLRIGSNIQRSGPVETETRLEVQEINGGIIRLEQEQEAPAPPKVARQVTFHERPVLEKGDHRQRGEGKDWGISRLHAYHWVIGGGVAVTAIVILAMLMLPSINAPNRSGEKASASPILIEEKDEKLEAVNRMLQKQTEAIQLFRAYSQASHIDEVVPLIRDGAALKEQLRSRWKPLNMSKQ
ncbi:MAG: hypothetical protein EOP85_16790, partial [Verrucomicrobiaceae bacterium]